MCKYRISICDALCKKTSYVTSHQGGFSHIISLNSVKTCHSTKIKIIGILFLPSWFVKEYLAISGGCHIHFGEDSYTL